jgi:arylsulfatase A-like enzyme
MESRKLEMAIVLVLAASLPAIGTSGRARAEGPGTGRPPNIVYILADDLGYGDLGCYNPDSKIPTPNLDRLAAEGIRFTDAHAPTSVCTPTRYAILTGRYSWRSRLKSGVLGPWGGPLIAADRLTVPGLLRAHGYATACLGKWHLGWSWPTVDGQPPRSGPDRLSNVDFTRPIADGPITRGFDSYFGVDLPNYPPYCFIEGDRTVGIPSVPNRPEFNRPGPMLPGWQWVDILPELTRRAARYLDDAAAASPRRPFFLYLALTAPHYPVVPAAEFRGKSGAGDYGDFVAQVDWTVGQVLDALKRLGLADDTLVFFTSDNGPEITGEVKPGVYDRAERFGHFSNGPLRGAKRDTWEGGHRVPFLARWPGKIAPGSVSDETVAHVDLMATVAAMLGAGLPDDAGEDSYDILPALLGREHPRPIREATVHHAASGKFAIRRGDWVLIDAPTGDDNNRRGETDWFKRERSYPSDPRPQPGALYNLRGDLPERHNLFDEHPDVVRELRALLERYRRDGRSTPGAPQPDDAR